MYARTPEELPAEISPESSFVTRRVTTLFVFGALITAEELSLLASIAYLNPATALSQVKEALTLPLALTSQEETTILQQAALLMTPEEFSQAYPGRSVKKYLIQDSDRQRVVQGNTITEESFNQSLTITEERLRQAREVAEKDKFVPQPSMDTPNSQPPHSSPRRNLPLRQLHSTPTRIHQSGNSFSTGIMYDSSTIIKLLSEAYDEVALRKSFAMTKDDIAKLEALLAQIPEEPREKITGLGPLPAVDKGGLTPTDDYIRRVLHDLSKEAEKDDEPDATGNDIATQAIDDFFAKEA